MDQAILIIEKLKELAVPEKAEILQKFFKTGNGEYGAGDRFLGIVVPKQRKVAITYWQIITEEELNRLIQSPFHEVRLTAVLILVLKFEKAVHDEDKQKIFTFYLNNRSFINNWDLVDVSAPNVIGAWLFGKDTQLLFDLAYSSSLWDNRIAIMATFYFIRKNRFEDTFQVATILLHHQHDLIHKAVGWMLREVAKRDYSKAFQFLELNYQTMPRTMLRYAIEKFEPGVRKQFLLSQI